MLSPTLTPAFCSFSPPQDPHAHGRRGPVAVVGTLTPVMSATVLLCSVAMEDLWTGLTSSPWFDGECGGKAMTHWVGADALAKLSRGLGSRRGVEADTLR